MLKGYYPLENALLSVGGADKFSYSQERSSGFAGGQSGVFSENGRCNKQHLRVQDSNIVVGARGGSILFFLRFSAQNRPLTGRKWQTVAVWHDYC